MLRNRFCNSAIFLLLILYFDIASAWGYEIVYSKESFINNNKDSIETDRFSQFFGKTKNFEFRLRNSTKIRFYDDERGIYLQSGSLGLYTGECFGEAETSICKVLLNKETKTVIKTVNGMDRICVLKGSVSVIHKNTGRNAEVEAGFERAFSEKYISDTYRQSDDLRFMWYWTEACEEPSLK